MFCYQCEQTAKGTGCTVQGVCGKQPEVAALQDLLLYSLMGLSQVAVEGRKHGVIDGDVNVFTVQASFSTLTNVDFDPDRFVRLINQAVEKRDRLKAKVKDAGGDITSLGKASHFIPEKTLEGLVKQAESVGLKSYPGDDLDIAQPAGAFLDVGFQLVGRVVVFVITLALLGQLGALLKSKIRWLKNAHPKLYEKLDCILLPHDYLNFVLTGNKAMEYGDASGTGLLDIRTRRWNEPLLGAIDDSRSIGDCLPPLVEAGEFIGRVTDEAAERFGLPAGARVAAGGGDNMMGAIGTGNVRTGVVTMSLGTSGTLYAHSNEPVVDPKGNIAAFCGSTGGWLPLLCTMNCTFATELMRTPLEIDVDAFDTTLANVPAGADGLVCLPFFNGERTPNLPGAKASLVGLDAGNCTKGHWLRATVEGATFGLKFGLDELAGLGLAAESIVLTGGGANSTVWRQIVADVTGLPTSFRASIAASRPFMPRCKR